MLFAGGLRVVAKHCMETRNGKTEEYQFQAEAGRLLDLMIHYIYTNEWIFLLGLISNASDALDKLRFEVFIDPSLLGENDKY
jgi:molecular chaperone HtpG